MNWKTIIITVVFCIVTSITAIVVLNKIHVCKVEAWETKILKVAKENGVLDFYLVNSQKLIIKSIKIERTTIYDNGAIFYFKFEKE